MKLKIPVGISDFEEIRRNGYYYIDKSSLIRELLTVSAAKVTLITRPRRFGKTLGMSMLSSFFDIRKESIFTGTNNFVSDTISGSRLDEYFGFTQYEVEKLLKDAQLESHADDIRDWYDGYHFGEVDVYCPWDVLNYIYDLQSDPAARPAGYWKNTSDNAIIRSFIDSAGSSITMKLESLMAGGTVVQKIEEELTYDCLHSSEENLWSILYLTGYLTRIRESELSAPLPDGAVSLIIPNAEIREIFRTTIIRWFQDSAKTWDRQALFHGVWTGGCF